MNSEQIITHRRRKYNQWVANETLEDFALRFTAKRARLWSLSRIASTALGTVSFLVLEALGGTITLSYGFYNSALAIVIVCLCLFLTAIPISYYAAQYGVDIDLLTRGAGFGYIGSTISSLIYASFTFIFFALEATIMSMALNILLHIPMPIAYIISSLVVIPLVSHGISRISQFQIWSQPLWLLLQLLPFLFILQHSIVSFSDWTSFPGLSESRKNSFDLLLLGAASSVLFSLIAQIGEQVDFLRFLPEKTTTNKIRWWTALILGGPGWVLFGCLKLFMGSFLAYLAIRHGVSADLAADPTHMYLVAFQYVTQSPEASLALAGIFVLISQLKINVANAYAGSLAWSNFFSRLTHHHPGRVVWMFFNVSIALLLMEMGAYEALENILKLFSSVVLAWFTTVVADLVINKPLGLSPKQIEFKRSHLYDINPVGVFSMLFASSLGILCHLGVFGETTQALSAFITLFCPFITVPFIAWLTSGRYYLARTDSVTELAHQPDAHECSLCEHTFDTEDMTYCPIYQRTICSLCCSLDARCGDACRPKAQIRHQIYAFLSPFLPNTLLKNTNPTFTSFLTLLSCIAGIMFCIFFLVYSQIPTLQQSGQVILLHTLIKIFLLLLIVIGVMIWLYILSQESFQSALEESEHQTILLSKEMDAHEKTYNELQKAKETAEAANHAKSRYLAGISHELRTPLNVILGYAQILEKTEELPNTQRQSINLITRNGEYLADLIEGLLEFSKIEAGKLELFRQEVKLRTMLEQISKMFQLQAEKKGLSFISHLDANFPTRILADEKRLRQILINLLSNSIKFTHHGTISFRVEYRDPIAKFIIEDSGIGIKRSDFEKIFQPFERLNQNHHTTGTGLGLAISRLLAELMGGDIQVSSTYHKGSRFTFTLMLSAIYSNESDTPTDHKRRILSYAGPRKSILLVDDEYTHRQLLNEYLKPFGFNIYEASNANDCLAMLDKISVDLLLLDISMPGMNGLKLGQLLREQNRQQPLYIISANARETHKQALSNIYFDAYFTKPINLENLLESIGKSLDLKWDYLLDETTIIPTQCVESVPSLTPQNKEILKKLRGMAEIGYLTAITDLVEQLELNHCLETETINTIKRHLKSCNFAQMIRLLDELEID